MDFASTAVVTSLLVEDLSGHVAFPFSANSGATYPEPGTGAILLLGLIASFARARRRRCHSKNSVP